MENRYICKSCGQKRNKSFLDQIAKSKNGFNIWLCKNFCNSGFNRKNILNKYKKI